MALRSPKPRPGRGQRVRPARRCRELSFESVKVRAYRRDPARIEGTQDILALEGANIGRREVDAPRAVHRLRMHAVPVPPHEPLQPVIGRLPGRCGMGRPKGRGPLPHRALTGARRLPAARSLGRDSFDPAGRHRCRRPRGARLPSAGIVQGVRRRGAGGDRLPVVRGARAVPRVVGGREVGLEPSRPAAMTDRTVFAASM